MMRRNSIRQLRGKKKRLKYGGVGEFADSRCRGTTFPSP